MSEGISFKSKDIIDKEREEKEYKRWLDNRLESMHYVRDLKEETKKIDRKSQIGRIMTEFLGLGAIAINHLSPELPLVPVLYGFSAVIMGRVSLEVAKEASRNRGIIEKKEERIAESYDEFIERIEGYRNEIEDNPSDEGGQNEW